MLQALFSLDQVSTSVSELLNVMPHDTMPLPHDTMALPYDTMGLPHDTMP